MDRTVSSILCDVEGRIAKRVTEEVVRAVKDMKETTRRGKICPKYRSDQEEEEEDDCTFVTEGGDDPSNETTMGSAINEIVTVATVSRDTSNIHSPWMKQITPRRGDATATTVTQRTSDIYSPSTNPMTPRREGSLDTQPRSRNIREWFGMVSSAQHCQWASIYFIDIITHLHFTSQMVILCY